MRHYESIIHISQKHIAGGVVSINRKTDYNVVFSKAKGSYLWDTAGNRYIDYHAAFAPYLLGHNHPRINAAVIDALENGYSLVGSGTTPWEAELAAVLCETIPSLEKVQLMNTGSEATANAIRLARAHTGREDIVTTLGGYNGWHDEVGRSVMPSLAEIGNRISPGEYPLLPISAGIPISTQQRIHVVNFNDLDSLEYVFRNHSIACFISEPVLQNVGVIMPDPNYLTGIRKLCDRYGVIWIMDEVKTGFRSAIGGYQSLEKISPDLSVFGKAIANGYPLAVLGGKAQIMDLIGSADSTRRVLIAGTYNGHPVNVAAALATIMILKEPGIYEDLSEKATQIQNAIQSAFFKKGIPVHVARNASALCPYFMSAPPRDWHAILEGHDFTKDRSFRRFLFEEKIYLFPAPCKQISVSSAHSNDDIAKTLTAIELAAKRF